MKNLHKSLICAAIFLGMVMPAHAAWDRIGQIDVDSRRDRDIRHVDLGGSVEALQLRAVKSDIRCRSVLATFRNGKTRNIFAGALPEGRSIGIDLPGRDRNIRRLEFNCKAERRHGAIIQVFADVGRHRSEWRRNPDWDRTWSRILNWGSNVANDWILLGSEKFEGRRDRETAFADWRGQRVDAIALKPLEADARCTSVRVLFGNGRTQRLVLNKGDVLRRGYFNGLDLPGEERNIKRLYLSCQAIDARAVTIQIFTSK